MVLSGETSTPDSTSVELVSGTPESVKAKTDKQVVIRITDETTQKVKVVCKKGKETVEKVYDLTNLTLLEA